MFSFLDYTEALRMILTNTKQKQFKKKKVSKKWPWKKLI